MVNTSEYKNWLKENTHYSDAVISDLASRAKRADKILEIYADEIYLFYLEREPAYKELSVSVRSQVKKAVALYLQFLSR